MAISNKIAALEYRSATIRDTALNLSVPVWSYCMISGGYWSSQSLHGLSFNE